MMHYRSLWVERINRAWESRSIVWLSGVRRVGKTTLASMLGNENIVYRNCDLPSVVRELRDPELFFESYPGIGVVVFDEIHQLADPSRLLKIAADAYPNLKILATGSSTLAATSKFKDALTGRKWSVGLTPVLWEECVNAFGIADLDRRLLRGGLPETLLADEHERSFYSEWFDSYYARDIAALFQLRNRTGFLALFHLLLQQSGGQLNYVGLSKETGITRPTVVSYIEALRVSHAIQLVTPFYGGGRHEIVRRPKCYAFDTGFVAWERGWNSIRAADRGILWEHLVLDSLRFKFEPERVHFWRSKSGKELDFVIPKDDETVDVYECKLNPDRINIKSLRHFRESYPSGRNYVVSPFVRQAYRYSSDDFMIDVTSLQDLPR